MNITSVVFDYGSVLAWPPTSAAFRRVASVAGLPESVLFDRYYMNRNAYDRHTIDDIGYWQEITTGYPAADDERLLRELAELDGEIWSEPNQSTIGWLPELKAAGITLAVLSNMPESFCEVIERRDRWLDIFDHRIFSGRVKLSKPEPEMYQLLLRTLSPDDRRCEPAEVLFLDDLAANVDAAREAGINAELYNVYDGGLPAIAERYGLPPATDVVVSKERLGDHTWAPHRQGV